jgi:hypothetical protein
MTLEATLREDLAAAVVGALSLLPADHRIPRAKELLEKMYGIRGQLGPGAHSGDGPRLAGSIILAYIDRMHPGNARDDRTEVLLALSERGEFRGVTFSGTMTRLNFNTIAFRNCTFDGVTFVKCEFGANTVFERCVFIAGTMPESCVGLERAKWILPREVDQAAAAWLNDALTPVDSRYTARQLENDVRCVIGRFIVNQAGTLKKTIDRDMIRGSVRNSPMRDDILDALGRYVIEIERRTPDGLVFQVRDSAREAMHFFATDDALTGPLKAAFVELKKKLDLQ